MFRLIPAVLALMIPASLWAQSADEIRFAKKWLADLQQQSFNQNREYCGYFGYSSSGRFAATRPQAGRQDSCDLIWTTKMQIFASYHTHGAFDRESYSEFPSALDMETDRQDGIDGYISTPGGRLWFIDSQRMVGQQICGLGCLPQDRNFMPGLDGRIHNSYSYQDILWIEQGG